MAEIEFGREAGIEPKQWKCSGCGMSFFIPADLTASDKTAFVLAEFAEHVRNCPARERSSESQAIDKAAGSDQHDRTRAMS